MEIRKTLLRTRPYSPPEVPKHYVRLDLNENRLGPSPKCLDALSNIPAGLLSSYSQSIDRLLTAEIADFCGVHADSVFVNSGLAAVLQQIFSIIDTGSTIALPSIRWGYYDSLAGLYGLQIREYATTAAGSTFTFATDSIRAERPALAVINSPHMPTGASVDWSDLVTLVRACPETLFIIDEAYWGFSGSADKASRIISLPNVVLTRSFSKYFALASIRIGFGIAHVDLVDQIRKAGPLFGISSLSSLIGIAALRDAAHYQATASELRRVRELFIGELRESCPQWLPYSSASNFVLIKIDNSAVCARITHELAEEGIIVRDCVGYGLPTCIRITVGEHAVMERVIRCMRKVYEYSRS